MSREGAAGVPSPKTRINSKRASKTVEFVSEGRRDCAARCDELAEEPVPQREGNGGCNKRGERDHGEASVLVASVNDIHGKVEQVAKKVDVGGPKRK
eukprot:scaffold100570_cov87-Phaeocystis_antarctica.AAC.3